MVQKRNLVFRAKNICTEDTLKDELQDIRNILRDNGFPDKFIEKHMVAQPRKPKTSGVPKKTLFLNLAFKGDLATLSHTAEAVCIGLLKPDLCIQKKYVQALALPWPEKT